MNNQVFSSWEVLQGKFNEKPILIRIYSDTQKLNRDKLFYRIGIVTPILHPQEDGMPIPEENITLQGMEEDILKIVEKNSEGQLCAVILTNGVKEMMFYSNKIKPDFIEEARQKFQNYVFQWYGKEDRDYTGLKQLVKEFGIE